MRTLLSIVILMLFALAAASAQQQPTEFDKILAKPITITGTQTVDVLCEKLTEQIGITVVAAEPIKGRKLTTEFANVSLKTLLDALTDLYGWIWKREGDSVIRLKRAPLPEVTQLSDLPQILVKVLPVDIRGLLMIEMPIKEGLKPELAALPNYADGSGSEILKRTNLLPTRIFPRMKQHYEEVVQPFTPLLMTSRSFPFEKWTASQKEAALAYLFLRELRALPPSLIRLMGQ